MQIVGFPMWRLNYGLESNHGTFCQKQKSTYIKYSDTLLMNGKIHTSPDLLTVQQFVMSDSVISVVKWNHCVANTRTVEVRVSDLQVYI